MLEFGSAEHSFPCLDKTSWNTQQGDMTGQCTAEDDRQCSLNHTRQSHGR